MRHRLISQHNARLKAGQFAAHTAGAVSLVIMLAFANAGFAQDDFDEEINIALDQLLPEALISSGEHRVSNVWQVGESTMEFEIESETAGTQRVQSIALTVIRIQEARTLAQAASQFAQDNRQAVDEGRGQINIGGDSIIGILGAPMSTGGKVVNQFGSNVKQTFEELGEFPDPAADPTASVTPVYADPVFQSHRRSVASQLKLDVYSSNPSVQRFLDTLARARGAGRARAGVTTISFASSPELEVDSGRLRERVRSNVLNGEQDALFDKADIMLSEAGIDAQLAARLLNHPVLTPTHKNAITEYVAFMSGVGNRGALIETTLDVTDEVEALSKVRIARMYAYYHQSWTPLHTLISAGHLALAIDQDGVLLVALPFDFLDWTPKTQRIFIGLEQFAERKGIVSKVLLLSGVTTDKARVGLEARGFGSFGRFLFAR